MSLENDKYIDTRICRVEKVAEGYALFHFKGNNDSSIEEFEGLIDLIMDLICHKPFVVMTDLRNNYESFTNEVKEYLEKHKELTKNKVAEAIIVNNLGIRLQVNFFIKFQKRHKMKLFTDSKKAQTWVLSQRK